MMSLMTVFLSSGRLGMIRQEGEVEVSRGAIAGGAGSGVPGGVVRGKQTETAWTGGSDGRRVDG